jgi:crotonobetainyl-CoA:carnitine CoA-transferase CaiB-like acyl-CoA transferase
LADLGGDVVRVEAAGSEAGPAVDVDRAYAHAGKRSVAIALGNPEGREAFARLAKSADVVVEGLSTVFTDVRGTHAGLLVDNPRLAWVAVRPFAPGVHDERPTSEIVRYAMSGLMSITGDPNDSPMLAGGGLSNGIVAVYAALAALLAVRSSRAASRGPLVWVSAHEALLSVMQQGLLDAAVANRTVKRGGSRHAHIAMAGALPCKDGHAVISANERRMWRSLVTMVGDARLADEALNDERERMRRQAEIFDVVSEWTARFDKSELADAAQAENIPVAPVHTMADVARDPHLHARGFFEFMGDAGYGPALHAPWVSPGPRPAPRPGQHTAEVLTEAGLSPDHVRRLATAGVVAVRA